MKKLLNTQAWIIALGVIATVFTLTVNTALGADKPKEGQLSPVTAFKDGFTLEQAKYFRNDRDCRLGWGVATLPCG